MKVDFKNIIVKDIESNENTVDISKELATVLYNSAVSIEALNKAKELKETGELEISEDMKDAIKQIVAANFYATVQVAVNDLLDSIEEPEIIEDDEEAQ